MLLFQSGKLVQEGGLLLENEVTQDNEQEKVSICDLWCVCVCVWVGGGGRCRSIGFVRENSNYKSVRLDYYRAYGTPGPKIKLAHVHGMYAMQSVLKQSCVYSIAAILIIVLQMFYLSIEPSLWGGISTGNLLKAGKSIWDGILCHILLHLGLQIMMIRLAHWEKNIFCGNNAYCFSHLCNKRAPSQIRDYSSRMSFSDTSQGF